MSLLPKREDYTFEDWLEMDNNEKIDLIDGVLYMRGEPSRRHQKVLRQLVLKLGNFLDGKICELYFDPFMVKLNKKIVVHPDISVICDKDKLDDKGCNGAPELIVEILSPSNMVADVWTKYNKYLMAGVKEYWIVDPVKNEVDVYILEDDEYHGTKYSQKDILAVTTLPGCEIDLSVIFAK